MISKQIPPVDQKIIGKDASKTKPIWIDIHGKITDKPVSEQFKDIEGYEGLYAVTNFGNVYSYKSNRFLKGRNNGKGYLQVQLFKQGKGKSLYIHRLVAQAFLPNIFPKIDWDVDHINNVRDDNRVTNLQYVTRFDNILLKDNRGEITMEEVIKMYEQTALLNESPKEKTNNMMNPENIYNYYLREIDKQASRIANAQHQHRYDDADALIASTEKMFYQEPTFSENTIWYLMRILDAEVRLFRNKLAEAWKNKEVK